MLVRLIVALMAGLMLISAQPSRAEDWRQVWSDEFDGSGLDRSKWDVDVDCWGGGNGERQCYTASPRNAQVVDGKLVITALRQHATGPALPKDQRRMASDPNAEVSRDFTSARLTTRGKAAWRFGRIEVRARLPQGQGLWPAIWMLPEKESYGPWASSGEIDILEAVNLGVPCASCVGGREDTILGTLHFGKPWPNNVHSGTEIHFPDVLDGFHTYAIAWDADHIVWQVDGRPYAERKSSQWWSSGSTVSGAPFDKPFYLILNLAVGGGLAESRGLKGVSAKDFPKRFEIDWIRVWQKDGQSINSATEPATAGSN